MKTERLILQGVHYMSRKGPVAAGMSILLTGILAGTAVAAPSNISFHTGTVASYDFGGFGPGYPVPGTIQIHAFTMQPGDTTPWHYHRGELWHSQARHSNRAAPRWAASVRQRGIEGWEYLHRISRSSEYRYQP